MNRTRPRTQSFAARVIEAIASDGQNRERTQKNGAVCSIAARPPCEPHMRVQEHPDQYENRHRRTAVNFHRPGFRAHLNITRRRDEIIPRCPYHSAQKNQRQNGVEKISLASALIESSRVAGVA